MAYKLYFRYGVMGSSKTAQALMTKFNYEQQDYKVFLIKPSLDTRDSTPHKQVVKSRIGLEATAISFTPNDSIEKLFEDCGGSTLYKTIIVDECQFCTKEQIEQLKNLTARVPVFCYGLKTDFQTHLFEGSKRLLEIADSITEIKSICSCGKKAIINARFCGDKLITSGNVIDIGGDEKYRAVCYECYKKLASENQKTGN